MIFPVSVLPVDERKDDFALKKSLVANCPVFIVYLREHRSVPYASFVRHENFGNCRSQIGNYLSLESKLHSHEQNPNPP